MAIDSLVIKYQPPLDYIASYQVQIDFQSEASGTMPTSKTRTPAQIDTDAEKLAELDRAALPAASDHETQRHYD
jgi:hypothetical protein